MSTSREWKREHQDPGFRYAAIDVGSNAMRLLFMQVLDGAGAKPCFRKVSLFRMPLRLGTQAFLDGRLGKRTRKSLLQSMQAFRLLMDAWQPLAWRACATSALRNIDGSAGLLEEIRQQAGLELEIISGKEEARLLLANQPDEFSLENGRFLYVDVGGGSTELTLLQDGRATAVRSFAVGTVRQLTGSTKAGVLDDMDDWLRSSCKGEAPTAVGSGGNVNKLCSLIGLRKNEAIHVESFNTWYHRLTELEMEARIRDLGLRPDRADVMPHALDLYYRVMQAAGSMKMIVPRTGLADALIRDLYQRNRPTS